MILNLPIILLAFVNIVSQYKLKRTTKDHFRQQIITWITITLVLFGSFPIYNLISGRPTFQSDAFSAFDIIQTTAIVYLIYIINRQRQKIEQTEQTLRELHQELSIKLSKK
jgi:hypothetical protein